MGIDKWKEFEVGILFDIKGSKTTSKETLEEIGSGAFPYITTSTQNNSVDGYYSFYTEKGNVITMESACLGFATYQLESFSASDHVELLKPKFELNAKIGLFFVTILNSENLKYSYGRKCNQIRIKNIKIRLPICYKKDKETPMLDNTKKYSKEGYIPDFKFMEEYIKSLPYGDRL